MSSKPTIAVLGSHSALDVCRGAKDFGFRTLVVAEKGREKTYDLYYKSQDGLGCVDECLVLDTFLDILKPAVQQKLKNAIFIPNRSFEAYLNFNYEAIERTFTVPMFGNRFLLKLEERNTRPNQYDLLDEAGIRYPKHFKDPKKIDRLCLVKVSEKTRAYERAFFLASSLTEFKKKSSAMISDGKITHAALENAVIEEFVLGPQVNFNFFYSPLNKRLELIGTDTRRQTNLDGILRLPTSFQFEALTKTPLSYEEAGHVAVTVLESLLEKAFELGEKFIAAAKKLYSPGIIGPFALQCIVTSGPPKKDLVVVDVSPRMPGSPGISATPYGSYLYGTPLTMGKRVAMEIKHALKTNKLSSIVT